MRSGADLCRGLLMAACVLLPSALAAQPSGLPIYTDEWPPYVHAQGEPYGSAARVLRLVVKAMGAEVDWQYYDFGFSYRQVADGDAVLAFPYFKTEQRARQVLFSAPLFEVNSRIYFNRQFLSLSERPAALDDYRMGRVAGYSYGEQIDTLLDQAQVYPTERSAMEALLNNDIELLPMTEAVAAATLRAHFPNRLELIRPVPGIRDRSSLHLIGSATAKGRALIEAFDAAYAQLMEQELVGFAREPLREPRSGEDVAELVAAEGFPMIVGHTAASERDGEFFAIPAGTRALVLEWSPKIQQPVLNDRVYGVMVDLSRVVILSGPHVGKELYVKNMHINLL